MTMKTNNIQNPMFVEKKPAEYWEKRFDTDEKCIEHMIELMKEWNPTVSEHSIRSYRSTVKTIIKNRVGGNRG